MDDYYWAQSMDGSPVAASGPTISALRFIQNYDLLFYLLCMPRQM